MAKLNDIVTRSISGTVFVLIILGSLFWLPTVFGVVFGLAMLLVIREFYGLSNTQKNVNVQSLIGLFGALLLFLLSYLNASEVIEFHYFLVYLFFVFTVFIIELFRETKNPIHNLSYFVLGQVYVALPFSILSYIYWNNGAYFVLAIFLGLWINDVGAYMIGSMIGKHKLFERISPKKTWEGFLGGMVLAGILGYVLSLYIPELSLIQWIIFTQLVSIFGTLGDLVESMLKRTVGVKDSGNIMPGHGGLLDRLDSMIFSTPIIFIYLTIVLQ